MLPRTKAKLSAGIVAAAMLLAAGGPASAQIQIGVYGGWNGTLPSDVAVNQPGGPNETFFDVPWEGHSFSPPIYYGVRGIFWFAPAPGWGVMIDFTHAKAYADLDAMVETSSGGTATLSDTFSRLEFTDGLNFLTANAIYRWNRGRLMPYAGFGIGVTIPHVEVDGPDFQTTFEYQITGAAAQAFAGVELPVGDRFALFGELKVSHARINADLTGGGSLRTNMLVFHASAGISLKLGHAF